MDARGNATLDKQIELLMNREKLPEEDIKALCEKVSALGDNRAKAEDRGARKREKGWLRLEKQREKGRGHPFPNRTPVLARLVSWSAVGQVTRSPRIAALSASLSSPYPLSGTRDFISWPSLFFPCRQRRSSRPSRTCRRCDAL